MKPIPQDSIGELPTLRRRTALLGIASGAVSIGAASRAQAQPTPGKPAPIDVAIIGAGMAGVVAARELGTRGHRCVLLEARNRIGGRTFTTEVFGEPGDVGGQWVHWIQPHVWAEITRYGLELLETPGANPDAFGVVIDGKLRRLTPDRAFEVLNSGMRKFAANAAELFPRPMDPGFNKDAFKLDSLSLADRFRQVRLQPLERAVLESFLATGVNGKLDQAGYLDQVHWYARADQDLGRLLRACSQFKIRTRTGSLLNHMLHESGAELRLNSVVNRVEQDERGVRVSLEGGQVIEARACVVALPMNCWNDIDWRPGLLKGKIAASKERHAGEGFELKIKLKGNKGSYQGMAPSSFPINMIYTDKITDEYTVMIGMGSAKPGFDVNDDEHVRKAVQRLMPGAEVLESYAYDWNADPFSKGTWCDYRPSMWSRYGADMRQTEGRLVFAGSDIANGWRGFIDGAIETGLRAAREVHTTLKKA